MSMKLNFDNPNRDYLINSYLNALSDKMCDTNGKENESWFTDDFSQCDNCPDWDDEKGCKSYGKECEDGGTDDV